jgi:hypothetical protein
MARPSRAQRRFGYLVSIAVESVMLWGAHRILDWGWFGFLTQEWTRVLPVLTASFVVGIVANVLFLFYDGVWLKASLEAVEGAFGIAVSVQVWRVWPFDFTGYLFPWETVVRVLLVLSIVGSAIAILVSLGRLVRAAIDGPDEAGAHRATHDETAPPAV